MFRPTRLVLLFALALAACTSSEAPECSETRPATLDDVYAKHLSATVATGCAASGCHGTGAGSLTFRDAHELWAAVVDKPAHGGRGALLVTPGDPAKSFLVTKLLDGANGRMPQGGPYLSDEAILELAGWICAGAPEPGASAPDGGSPDGGVPVDPPVIESFTPTSGLAGTAVTITGTRFGAEPADNEVTFGEQRAEVSSASTTRLVVKVPEGATSGPIHVTVDGVTGESATAFEVVLPNPVPVLAEVSPSVVAAGGADLTISLSGSGFVTTPTAQVDGDAVVTTFVDATHLTAVVPEALVAAAGSRTLTVVNPGPGGGTSAGVALSVEHPVPSIAKLTPASVLVGTSSVTVLVEGSGFSTSSRVDVNGSETSANVTSARRLAISLSRAQLESAASLAISVTNPTPGGGTSAPATFVVANPAPVLESVAPARVLVGSGSPLVLTGQGFLATSVVELDGEPLATTYVDGTQLTVTLSAASTARAREASLVVRTPGPGGGESAALVLTIANPAPSFESLEPAAVAVGSAATTITISGSGFVPGTEILFEGSPLTTTFVSASVVTAIVPPTLLAEAGASELVVHNAAPGGGSSAPIAFEVRNPAPQVTSLAPASALVGSDSVVVTITGSAFVPSSIARLGEVALPTTFASATSLTASLAGHTSVAGAQPITVRTPAPGGGTSVAATFVLENPVPTIESLAPSSVLVGSDRAEVVVTGSGFVTGSLVTVGGTSATVVSVEPTRLVFLAPASQRTSTASVGVVITNAAPGGGSSASAPLSVVNPVPAVTGLAPSSLVAGSEARVVTISGTGFVQGSQALLGTTNLETRFVNATTLEATVDAASLAIGGTLALTIRNGSPGGGTSAARSLTVNNPSPSVTAISPTDVVTHGAAFTLTVTGSGFNASTRVTLDGAPITVTALGATAISARVGSLDTPGEHELVLTNPLPGGGSATATLTATDSPLPSITGLDPSVTLVNAPFTLVLSGANFSCTTPESVVLFDGVVVLPTSCSATRLEAEIPAHSVGAYDVQVRTAVQLSNTVSCVVADPNPVPVATSISPTVVGAGGASFTLSVQGSSFVRGAVVRVQGAPRATTFVSSTSLTATVPASDLASVGTAQVTVTNPPPAGGTSGALSLSIVPPNPVPSVTSLTPALVGVGSGAVTVSIVGTGFLPTSTVSFEGSPRVVRYTSATQLSVDLIAADTQQVASRAVVVTNPGPGGGPGAPATFRIVPLNPVPMLTAASPASGVAGSASVSLTLDGSGFVNGSTVAWDGAARATTLLSSTQLVATILSSDLATAGTHALTVTSPAPGGGTSASISFVVVTPNPVPVLSTTTPVSALAGSGAIPVTLAGSGFLASSVAAINGNARPTHFSSASQLTVDLTAADLQAAGTATLTVTNPAPGGGTSAGATFTVLNPSPVISALSPTLAPTGASSLTLTVTGSAFVAASVVRVNGSARPTTFVSPTQLTAALSSSDLATSTTLTVTVFTPQPGGGTTAGLSLPVVVHNPVPSLSAASPNLLGAGSGATSITLDGAGFVATSTANLNGSPRVTRVSTASRLVVDLLASDLTTPCSCLLTVTNPTPGGGTSSAFTLSVVTPNPVPVLSQASPASALAGSGTLTVSLSGSGFVPGSVASFNGVPKTTVFASATALTVTLSSADLATGGTFPLVVTSPAPGGGTSSVLPFVVNNPVPSVTSLSPDTVAAGGGAITIALNGSGFVTTSAVTVDGAARVTRYVNTTLVSVDLLASDVAAAGTRVLVVTNPAPGGGASVARSFVVTPAPNPVPAITALSPCGRVAGSGAFTLTLEGSAFVEGATVTFNGTPLAVTFVDANSLTAQVPAALVATAPAQNVANVVVTNPLPGGGPSSPQPFGIAGKVVGFSAVQSIFNGSCTGCHGGPFGSGGLDLSQGQARSALLDSPSSGCFSRPRVTACIPLPSHSVLLGKLTGIDICSGGPMPSVGSTNLQTIVDWIAQGAP